MQLGNLTYFFIDLFIHKRLGQRKESPTYHMCLSFYVLKLIYSCLELGLVKSNNLRYIKP